MATRRLTANNTNEHQPAVDFPFELIIDGVVSTCVREAKLPRSHGNAGVLACGLTRRPAGCSHSGILLAESCSRTRRRCQRSSERFAGLPRNGFPYIQWVNDAFELLDPANAQAFLRKFPADARRKGQTCFDAGCVHELAAEVSGKAYSAVVHEGNERNEVQLFYDGTDGWSGTCSRPEDDQCLHLYAAMRALLADTVQP